MLIHLGAARAVYAAGPADGLTIFDGKAEGHGRFPLQNAQFSRKHADWGKHTKNSSHKSSWSEETPLLRAETFSILAAWLLSHIPSPSADSTSRQGSTS